MTPVATVDAIYRGWLGLDERGELLMSGEGKLAARLQRDFDRFGHRVRLRYFAASSEIPLADLRALPWKGEDFIRLDKQLRAPGINFLELLKGKAGQYVHIQIEWEL